VPAQGPAKPLYLRHPVKNFKTDESRPVGRVGRVPVFVGSLTTQIARTDGRDCRLRSVPKTG